MYMLSDAFQTLVSNYCFADMSLSDEKPNVGKTLPFTKKKLLLVTFWLLWPAYPVRGNQYAHKMNDIKL